MEGEEQRRAHTRALGSPSLVRAIFIMADRGLSRSVFLLPTAPRPPCDLTWRGERLVRTFRRQWLAVLYRPQVLTCGRDRRAYVRQSRELVWRYLPAPLDRTGCGEEAVQSPSALHGSGQPLMEARRQRPLFST